MQLAHAAAQIAAARGVWASVDALTPVAWAGRELERLAEKNPSDWPRLLAPAEEWLLWREATQEAAQRYPLLEKELLAGSLQRSSERAAAYHIRLAGALGGDSEAALLCAAQRSFDTRCRALNAASVSALIPRLRDTRAPGELLLRGFDVIPPWLRTRAPAASGDSSGRCEPRIATVRGLRTPDGLTQLEAIAAWCRERLSAKPDARLFVMLPGPAGARERLAQLIRDTLDPAAKLAPGGAATPLVGIEGADPFGVLPLPSQALLSLGLLAGHAVGIELITRWLTAPGWTSPNAAARAQLARLLRERAASRVRLRELLGVLQLAPRELKTAARELDAKLQQAGRRLGEGRASPRRWSERFEAALTSLGWPGTVSPGGSAHQIRLRWRELLEEFGELSRSIGSLELAAAVDLLRALALRTVHRPAEEGLPVTISAVLSDPVVIYDGLWAGSLSADQLPLPPAPDPFLPLRAQLDAGVPEAGVASRRAQAERLLSAWQRGAQELVLSVPLLDEDRELLPSPCLAGIDLPQQHPASPWLPLRLHRQGFIESIADARGTTFNPLTPLPGGTRALTLQNACPFRAYAELRLGASAPEEAEPGVPMDQRGLLLHAALQTLWERLQDSQRLAALDESALDALIGECVEQAARALHAEAGRSRRRVRRTSDAQFDLFTVLSPALERECRRARLLIHRLCRLERSRAPFAVEATEQVAELVLGGGRVRLRLDRVDRLAEGRAVLDYKSGRPGSPDWYGERPTHPQLLAYLTALGSDVVALATVNLTAREVRFTGVGASADLLPRVKAAAGRVGEPPDWGARQRAWQAVIEQLIRAFLAGEAQVDPAAGACDYCHITDICRIVAHLAADGSRHADDADD